MADAAARSTQYEYKANSNLVLQADVRLIDRRARDEATGEVMSLTGKFEGTRMGDKSQRQKPVKKQKREPHRNDVGKSSGRLLQNDTMDDISGIMYRPKTQDTKQTYEVLLSFIQEALSDQPRDVLCGAADEVLIVLKNDKLKDKEKKKDTEMLLGSLPEERFALLVNLGKKITDFGQEEKGDEQVDDQYGINVEFEDTDEDNDDDDLYQDIREEEDGDEERDEEGDDHAIHAETTNSHGVDLGGRKEKKLHPLDIDAYWLQRKLSKFYSDPIISQERAGDVLEVLKTYDHDERECENQLVLLLGFPCFDFIKLLKQNRQMILYCSLLASAQTEEQKTSIQEEMKSNPVLNRILRQLDTTRDDTGAEPMEVDEKGKRSSNSQVYNLPLFN